MIPPPPIRMAVPESTTISAFDSGLSAASEPVRLRLVSCRLDRTAGAQSRVSVEFALPFGDETIVFRQQGPTCIGGDLRLAALATLDAVAQVAQGSLALELVGVKPVRAFDTNLMVVALLAHGDGRTRRIVGTAIAEDDALAGVARATLHAVNRLLAPHLTRLAPFA